MAHSPSGTFASPSGTFASPSSGGTYPTALTVLRDVDFDDGETPRTLVEIDVASLAGLMRDKPSWWTKIHDEAIVAKWKQEYLAGLHEEGEGYHTLSETDNHRIGDDVDRLVKRFEYALAENQWLALQQETRRAAVEGVFGRDDVDEALRERMVESIKKLRELPAIGSTKEDRHPGTPQIIDLVHPSLYAYERSKTFVLGDATVLENPTWASFIGNTTGGVDDPIVKEPRVQRGRYAHRDLTSQAGLQWLPAEVVCSEEKATFRSYINNLHPKAHPTLYRELEELFATVVPLFEAVLADLGTGKEPRERPLRIEAEASSWYRDDQEDDDEDEEETDDSEERFFARYIEPDLPGPFDASSLTEYLATRKPVSLKDRPLQVIVKIARLEIEAQDRYSGGTWHVEGVQDEHIVATACCYVDSDNVQGGELEFRTAVREPEYDQSDDRGIFEVYGLANEEPLIQSRGRCSTPQSRILAWPNTLQHCVAPVRLVDAAKPGHRTIVCFFLVDPALRIRSTATVPPQQEAWLQAEINALFYRKVPERALRDAISDYLGTGISYPDAVARRSRLMDERRAVFDEDQDYEGKFYERLFSLCEH